MNLSQLQQQHLLEEYRVLSEEARSLLAEVRQLEKYAVLLVGGVFLLLASTELPDTITVWVSYTPTGGVVALGLRALTQWARERKSGVNS